MSFEEKLNQCNTFREMLLCAIENLPPSALDYRFNIFTKPMAIRAINNILKMLGIKTEITINVNGDQ